MCAGGWYRIAPRGYVCVGKGATLSLEHQVVQAALRGPARGAPLPYSYVMSRHPPPHLYFRLPTRDEQEHAEGATLGVHLAKFGTDPTTAPYEPKRDPVPQFLLDGLLAVEGDEVVLETLDPLKPATLKGTDHPEFLYLLMPVRVS